MNFNAVASQAKQKHNQGKLGSFFIFHIPELEECNRSTCGVIPAHLAGGEMKQLVQAIKEEYMRLTHGH